MKARKSLRRDSWTLKNDSELWAVWGGKLTPGWEGAKQFLPSEQEHSTAVALQPGRVRSQTHIVEQVHRCEGNLNTCTHCLSVLPGIKAM